MEPNDQDYPTPLTRYGMIESRERLEKAGLHPEVTGRTLKALEEEFTSYQRKKVNRPSRKFYLKRQRHRMIGADASGTERRGRSGKPRSLAGQRGHESVRFFGPLTRGPWYPTEWLDKIVSEAAMKTISSEADTNGHKEPPTMESIMNHSHLGAKILNDVFAQGHRTVINLALTSTKMLKLVTENINRWDFDSGSYRVKSPSNVFVAMVPTRYTGEIKEALSKYNFPVRSSEWNATLQRLESQGHPDGQKLRAIGAEYEFFQKAKRFRRQCLRKKGPYWAMEDTEIDPRTAPSAVKWWRADKEAINIMGSLMALKTMWSANQFEGDGNRKYQLPLSMAMEGLHKLMTEMHTVSTYIEVVHLHDVPLLDRRMLAVMLRGMPHVVQVGVYRCRLVHFGDVIPVLDLIYEINAGRREKKMPAIKGLDFYPNFEDGMPYEHQHAATYGLTWGPLPMDLVQRGFYGILLKAVMKAKAMNLGQLFEKEGALMDWLAKVPNVPLGPYCFLDALYRYLEVDDQDPDQDDKRTQATYDLLKPIRIATESSLSLDWPMYYTKHMGRKYFCSSCGYETFREFFPNRASCLPRFRRTCCACELQAALDEEKDHAKAWKLDMLDVICPLWQRREFNMDAPLYGNGAGLICLKSTETDRERHLAPQLQELPLIRDNKRHFDSLVGLPSLGDVTKGFIMAPLWQDAVALGFRYDLQRRGILELRHRYYRQWKGVPAFSSSREDGGAPDHEDELQPVNVNRNLSFFDHQKALDVANRMRLSGW
ncbi:uncharacterized protein TRIREDRAFT_109045 [Trichoderma reesei QM6a]|uniref:Predicted protein n=2 Tax=Hypocrea jecorina TaxID=51453 RepID=G0RNP7_HYPJQ|nr:uncharacterized protein TRIREDRAFT_109045 [Trichoderma reesei QM6a]EGR47190.1 predicted protein [Trichoderma reesei QM6a]ETS00654.1 hypothetical protein M419DRAFT_131300 [Trichoderma reesei RUT C-30]